MVLLSIRTEFGAGLDLTDMPVSPGVLLSLSVCLTCLGFWLTHAQLHTASATGSFVAGVKIVLEFPIFVVILSSILGSIVGTRTGRVQLLYNFCCTFPLLVCIKFPFPSLVWVTVFVLLAGSYFCHSRSLSLIHNIQRHWFSNHLTCLLARSIYLASHL